MVEFSELHIQSRMHQLNEHGEGFDSQNRHHFPAYALISTRSQEVKFEFHSTEDWVNKNVCAPQQIWMVN